MTASIVRRTNFVPADTDPAFATTEADQESVWSDFAPDMQEYIKRSLLVAKVFGALLALGAMYGLGYFVGWVMWGQA